ncbi:hypothetical protein SAMN05444365_1199 [Micromonospora pattaloongensis]|uniref:Uncharacterized protein n=1 Tax=Micromonospora pattaloongensis TaxID=405436 RepID=A0A1H3T801_9ACTN|nr:hypothetical protein [Micromonospora pattaloongensis]SDZ46067.1 hypothetical protein SAMN05444365_1199 [Micromonospora pattaloongensis]
MDHLLDLARQQLEQAKNALTKIGLRYTELDPFMFGVGVGVPIGLADYVVISVSGGGNESMVNLTSGVLQDLPQDPLKILSVCNSLTRDNPIFPHFLHDAQAGWAVLVQHRALATVLHDVSGMMQVIVENLPVIARQSREKLTAAGVTGRPFDWNVAEANHLLIRSLM